MKAIVIFAIVVCAFAYVKSTEALPLATDSENHQEAPKNEQAVDTATSEADLLVDQQQQQEQSEEPSSRHKRATCDLLSAAGVNHTACAAHCLIRGNRGGYCNGRAVCVCRN